MTKRVWHMLILMTLTIVLLCGCDNGLRMFSSGKPDYSSLSARLVGKGFEDTLAKAGVKALNSSGTNDKVELQVRRAGDVRKPLTDEDLQKAKQAIFDEVGYKFKLELSAFTIGDTPHTQGRVTAIDGTQLLIVDEKNTFGANKSPVADWYNFGTPDASLKLADGTDILLSEIQIGYRVQAWNEGFTLTSYPGLTSGLVLNVLSRDPGPPEEQGLVSSVHLAADQQDESYIVVGEKKIMLADYTQYLVSERPTTRERIQVGDEVRIRTTGLAPWKSGVIVASQIRLAS